MATVGTTWQATATTSQVALATAGAGEELWITQIRIVNSAGSTYWVKMWADFDGTTYDQDSIIWPQQSIPSNKIVFDTGLIIIGEGGSLAIQAEANSALTVHAVGVVRT